MVVPCVIVFLHIFKGVGGANFVLTNNCSETIWPAIEGEPTLSGQKLHPGNSVAVEAPPTPWVGRFWGRTGCNFSTSGNGSCTTGDCGSGQLDCKIVPSATTFAELSLGGPPANNKNNYYVSLIRGYNLPLLLQPSGQCPSAGCAENLNPLCPPELRSQDGRTSRSGCVMAGCPRPSNYSQLFKKVCPNVYTLADDSDTTFTCSGGSVNFSITFCPASLSHTRKWMPPAESPAYSPIPTTNEKNHTKLIILVVTLSITCLIIFSIALLCFLKSRHSTSVPNKKNNQHIEKILLQHGSVAPKRYKYYEIKKITKSFSDKLGKGGYGSVYRGVLPDGSLVAVKVLMETDSNGDKFINEVASISRTSHVNVVTLLGFCYEGEKRALVYEFMPNKSLDKFLSNDRSANNSLDLVNLYEIAVGIAKGLEYLHTGCNTRIVHFDIKPQNILLDEDFCPKISDFGLAKLCKKKQSVLSVLGTRGTIGYIAPEVFSRTFGGVSHKSDVYSYGMMILEMAGAKRIGESNTLQSSENYFPDKIYEHAILGITGNSDGFMIEDVEETEKKMFLEGFWCIQTNPSDRPPMYKVVEMLEGSVESIQIPPKPVLFTPTLPQQEFSSSLSAYTETENSIEVITIG